MLNCDLNYETKNYCIPEGAQPRVYWPLFGMQSILIHFKKVVFEVHT